MTKGQEAAAAALTAYVNHVGPGEAKEPPEDQAADLVTDVLLLFEPATAAHVLDRATRDWDEEQADVQPHFPPAE